MQRISGFVIFLVLLLSLGCVTKSATPFLDDEVPLVLEAKEVRKQDEQLLIRGLVSSKADWPLNDIVVGLLGTHDGLTIVSSHKALEEVLIPTHESEPDPILKAGQSREFAMSIPAAGVSDYQLELSWGREARQHVSARVSFLDIKLEPACEIAANCPGRYVLTGAIQNSAHKRLGSLKISLQFFDAAGQALFEATDVVLEPLSLGPQETQAIRLNLDAELPEGITPRVQVIEAVEVP